MNELAKRVLSTLMVSGAQSRERALAIEEIAAKVQVPPETVVTEVNELVVDSYAEVVVVDGVPRVHLTGTGVITASSTYS